MSEFIGISSDQEIASEKEKIPLDIMIFDTLFNPDSIENMQILDLMDDALSMDLIDLLKLLEFMNFSVTKEELIKIIGDSQFYIFDENNNKMRLRHKLQRRTIVFPSYDKKEDIREFFKNKLKCDEQIKSIEKLSSGIIFIYFETEEETIEVFKRLEKYKYENNLELYASIRCENLKRKLSDRIEMKIKQFNNDTIYPFLNKAYIIQDKEHYVPRRLDGESLARCYREIPYFGYKSNDCFLKKDEVIKRRSHSFYEVDPFPIEEKADLTPKSRKTTNNKFDGDVRSSIKNYYNKYNLVFDPEKYSYNRMNSGKLLRKRSMVLDLDSLPERKTQSSMYLIKKDIIYRYSIQEILQYYEDYHNQRTQRPKAFEKFIPPIMTYTSKLTLDQFREKKEKRERAATFFETSKKGYDLYPNNSFRFTNNNHQNNVYNKLGNNNHNNFKFTIYNPARRRIGSYNLIN